MYTQIQRANSGTAVDRQQTPGDLRVAVQGCPASQTIGSLLIKYNFEYLDPKPVPSSIVALNTPNISLASTGSGVSTPIPMRGTGTGWFAMGTNASDLVSSSAGNLTAAVVGSAVELSAGSYLSSMLGSVILTMTSGSGSASVSLYKNTYGAGTSGGTLVASSNVASGTTGSYPLTGNTAFSVVPPAVGVSQQDQYYYLLGFTGNGSATFQMTMDIAAYTPGNIGDEKKPSTLKGTEDDPGRSFVLPEGLDAAEAYLSTLPPGSVVVIPYSQREEEVTELQQMKRELEDMKMILTRRTQVSNSSEEEEEEDDQKKDVSDEEYLLTMADVAGPAKDEYLDRMLEECRERYLAKKKKQRARLNQRETVVRREQ